MYPYLITTAADLRREELLRQAEDARRVAEVREPHFWRHRLGGALIRLGRVLAEEPARPRPRATEARPRPSVA